MLVFFNESRGCLPCYWQQSEWLMSSVAANLTSSQFHNALTGRLIDLQEKQRGKANSLARELRSILFLIRYGQSLQEGSANDNAMQVKTYQPRSPGQTESRVSHKIFFVFEKTLVRITFVAQWSRNGADLATFRQHEKIINNAVLPSFTCPRYNQTQLSVELDTAPLSTFTLYVTVTKYGASCRDGTTKPHDSRRRSIRSRPIYILWSHRFI